MTVDPLTLTAAVSGILGLMGVVYTARKAAKSSGQTSATQLIESALDQTLGEMRATITSQGQQIEAHDRKIQALEREVSAKDRIVRAAAMFIDRIGLWLEADMNGPKPKPAPVLQEHIDTSFWLDQQPATD